MIEQALLLRMHFISLSTPIYVEDFFLLKACSNRPDSGTKSEPVRDTGDLKSLY
jgi:hypothetical protein